MSFFVTEIPIKASSKEQAVLKKRFWAAKQQYNALLRECLKRLGAMRADENYKKAQALNKQEDGKIEARRLFEKMKKKYGYSQYSLQECTKIFNTPECKHLSIGSALSQNLAKRIFKAVEEYREYKRGTTPNVKTVANARPNMMAMAMGSHMEPPPV